MARSPSNHHLANERALGTIIGSRAFGRGRSHKLFRLVVSPRVYGESLRFLIEGPQLRRRTDSKGAEKKEEADKEEKGRKKVREGKEMIEDGGEKE